MTHSVPASSKGDRRPGRPAGVSTARDDILRVAQARFLRDGYHEATLRAIAEEARVDPALISYHFGSKRGLLGAAMTLGANPAEILADTVGGPLPSLPERLLATLLSAWDDPATGGPLHSFVEAAVSDREVGRLFRELVELEMIPRLAEAIGGADGRRRAAMVACHMAGVVMARYMLRLEPLASMPAAEVVRRVSPSMRLDLFGSRPAERRGNASRAM